MTQCNEMVHYDTYRRCDEERLVFKAELDRLKADNAQLQEVVEDLINAGKMVFSLGCNNPNCLCATGEEYQGYCKTHSHLHVTLEAAEAARKETP